jgi:hypothetical protein
VVYEVLRCDVPRINLFCDLRSYVALSVAAFVPAASMAGRGSSGEGSSTLVVFSLDPPPNPS